ncbi:DUF4157 domain-containing protein [Bradyrhizobium yuanmingense]|uniref:eCIS core domain-containing protein n=1 Tax=Bradyrhizobium yuanmingense TaxID=108015 RepID=UPI0023B9643A|nr:DUF4157 domain-containing protein [Bradyrhizobium yuanmingense]MDF0515734.1 DUF4157 domain-containing protein [Bradyrhizobium yuanmingense]
MSGRTLATAQKQSAMAPATGRVLQRKCACGTHAGGTSCDECARKRFNLQRKLTIGSSSDPLEHEADRAADRVVGTSGPSFAGQTQGFQRSAGMPAHDGEVVPPIVDRVLSGPGVPLNAELRRDMERSFGYDFSMVRVHTDEASAQSAREVGARAYAVENHIVFGLGQFAPASFGGRWLLAHELAHVVQQGAVPASGARSAEARVSASSSGALRPSSSSRSVLRRDVTGCQDLLNSPGPPVPPAAGTFIHRAVLAIFMATVPGAIRIFIPGASANPQRTGGGKTVKPEKIGGTSPQAGKGTPDLAALNAAGVLQVAEIKPANWNQLLEGETQVATRYIDQGNASDSAQAAWRAKNGIKVVAPMLPRTFPVSSLFFPTPTNVIEIVLRWCQSGVLAYALRAHRLPEGSRAAERARVPNTESQRQQSPQIAPRPESLQGPSATPKPAPGPSTGPKPEEGGKVIPLPGGKAPEGKPGQEELPVAARSTVDKILEFIKDVIASGASIEQSVTKFLKENPSVLDNIELAVAAIVAGAVLSDVASLGTAIAKDPVVLAILAAMLRIADSLRPLAPSLGR